MLSERAAVRLGGTSGLLFVVLVVPSFLASPDTPIPASAPQDVIEYFSGRLEGESCSSTSCSSSSPPSSSSGS